MIDDVHACFETLKQQYTLNIKKDYEDYEEIMNIIGNSLNNYNHDKYYDITKGYDDSSLYLIPFWIWGKYRYQIEEIIKRKVVEDERYQFKYPLIKEIFKTCNCVLTSQGLEITPKSIPLDSIFGIKNSNRRIYMSATLSDDDVFTEILSEEETKDIKIITPRKADDMGERLFIYPQFLNNKYTDQEIREKVNEYSQKHNVVVLVPSYAKAQLWDSFDPTVVNYENIKEVVSELKEKHIGLVVIVNKYDGIDLPGDACRILVVDGMPRMRSAIEAINQSVLENQTRIITKQVQKIEQGLGRGVRSNTDYCLSFFIGREFVDILERQNGELYFSDATASQYNTSKKIWTQVLSEIKNPNLNEIFEIGNVLLNRSDEWIDFSKQELSGVSYSNEIIMTDTSLALRKAFDYSRINEFEKAVKIIEKVKNDTNDKTLKGFLLQQMAEYKYFTDELEAQEFLISGKNFNRLILCPIKGLNFQKLEACTKSQSTNLIQYINDHNLTPNTYITRINAVLDKLSFDSTSNNFESAIMEISFLIGLNSSRPEKEYGRGPDNLWALGNNEYWVIECKNEAVSSKINKRDCNQLNGSIQWLYDEYNGHDVRAIPLMIHKSVEFEYSASPNKNIRIMNVNNLEDFINAIKKFSAIIVNPEIFINEKEIMKHLKHFSLNSESITLKYSSTYKKI